MTQPSAGVRLGGKYIFTWTDAEPTGKMGIDNARSGILYSLLGLALVGGLIGGYFDGLRGAAIGAFVLAGLGGKGLAEGFRQRSGAATQFDNQHVTRPVAREASVVFKDDDFFFVVNPAPSRALGQVGAPLVHRWQDIDRFVHVPFWGTFGVGGPPDGGTEWAGIAMYPVVGPPAAIASTTAGEGSIYGIFTELNARFGPEARAEFMRQLEAEKRRGNAKPQDPPSSLKPTPVKPTQGDPALNGEVPKEL